MSDSIITGDGPSLLITHPDQTYTIFSLNEIEQLTIGYGSNAILRLTGDQTISRIQLELVREGNYYFVINRSMNRQTFLNKKPMAINEKTARPLHNDDEIIFGKYRLLFQDEEDTLMRGPASQPMAQFDMLKPANLQITAQATSKTGFFLKDGKAYYQGKEAKLTPKPYKLLNSLLKSYPGMCTTEDLLEELFPVKYDEVSGELKAKGDLHRLVAETRNQLIEGLGEVGRNLIATNHGFGYRLNLDKSTL